MREQLLELLKYAFLALVYLFLLNVILTVRRELKDPPVLAAASPRRQGGPPPPPGAAAPAPAPSGRRSKQQVRGRIRLAGPAHRKIAPITIPEQLTIGRSPGCGFPVSNDSTVSNVHARVYRRGSELWIEDLGSTNGTYVGGKRIQRPTQLSVPSVIRCGDSELEVIA